MLIEENKQLRDEVKKLNREVFYKRTNEELALKQTIAQVKKMESELKEKQ